MHNIIAGMCCVRFCVFLTARHYLFIQLLFLFGNIHVRRLLHKLYAAQIYSVLVLFYFHFLFRFFPSEFYLNIKMNGSGQSRINNEYHMITGHSLSCFRA